MNVETYNFSLFEKLSEKELGDWMYDGFVLLPARGKDDRSNLLHAQHIYKALPEALRGKVDRVLVESIKKWNPSSHSEESLDNMATYSALTQNKGAISHLITKIDSGVIQPNGEDAVDSFSTIIAVLAGFAAEDEAKKALKRWYGQNDFSWKHAALLAAGLVNGGEPLGEVMPHLIATMDAHPKYFREDLVAAELSRLSGVEIFEAEIKKHNGKSARKMREFLPLIRKILNEEN